MKLDVRHNVPEVQAFLDEGGRQARFATAVALTRTARDVREAERTVIRTVFDRPTPYTQNSLFVKPATKADLEARVWLKDDELTSGTPATKYLLPQIEGGRRHLKRFESMLQRIGALPRGWYAVPGEAAKLDAYGNMSRGQIVQVLSYLQAFYLAGSSQNATAATKARLARGTKTKRGISYFVSHGKLRDQTGHLPAGVWMRTSFGAWGSSVKPVLLFVRNVTYRKRFPFFETAEPVVRTRFPIHFEQAYADAMRTARPTPTGGQG